MKKVILFLVSILLALACSKVINQSETLEKEVSQSENLRKIALSLPSKYSDAPQTKKSTKQIKEIVPFSRYALRPITKSTTDSLTNGVYIVNYENDEGYAIFTEDERLIGYSDKGNMTDNISNPGLEYVMASVPEYASSLGDGFADTIGQKPDTRPIIEWHTTKYGWVDNKKGPLLNTRWNQWKPYNNKVRLCGYNEDGSELHSPAGCVAIAATQIMAYHESPEIVNGVNINWSRVKSTSNVGVYSPDAEGIAELISVVGIAVDMQYGCGTEDDMNESHPSVLFNNDGNAFWNMNYESTGHYNYNFDLVKTDIDYSLPVYTSGYRDSNWIGYRWEGHAWVIDGYNIQSREVITEELRKDPITGELLNIVVIDRYTEEQKLVHCNWGWGGISDGWYVEGLFDCNEIVEPDTGVSVDSTQHFYSHLQIITQIKPL